MVCINLNIKINSEPNVNGSELKRSHSVVNELSCHYREADDTKLVETR